MALTSRRFVARLLKRSWATPLFVGCVGVIVVFVVTKSSHCWAKRNEVTVARNGTIASGSSVYCSSANIWLIKVEGDENWYAFYPPESGMLVCNLRQHLLLPGYLLLRNEPTSIPCVWFSPVKAEDPQLVVKPEFIEFTSLTKERVHVTWNGALN